MKNQLQYSTSSNLKNIKNPVLREEERERRALLREKKNRDKLNKLRRGRDLIDVPSFLVNQSRRNWASLVASGIHLGFLEQCCDKGCIFCSWIGWKRAKHGTIMDIKPPFFTTGQYAKMKNCSYKTVARLCDEGHISFFKIPGSNHRYLIENEDD